MSPQTKVTVTYLAQVIVAFMALGQTLNLFRPRYFGYQGWELFDFYTRNVVWLIIWVAIFAGLHCARRDIVKVYDQDVDSEQR